MRFFQPRMDENFNRQFMQKLLSFILFATLFFIPQSYGNGLDLSLLSIAKYHLGDQPEWKNNEFDDSQWPVIQVPQPIKLPKDSTSSYYWIRIHVSKLPMDGAKR